MWKDCQALQDEITALRRELHQIPEVGAQLPETAACLSAHLDRLGIPFIRSPRDSGLIASIQGGLPGRTVALRADTGRPAHPRGDRTSFFLPPPRRDARLRA